MTEALLLALALIAKHEGCCKVLKNGMVAPYVCPAGYWTQGYGLLVKDGKVPHISKEEAMERLKANVPIYMAHALKYSPGLAKFPKKLAAITSFIFNLGPSAYAGSTLRKKVNAEDWQGAFEQIQRWNKGGGRVLRGLEIRRLEEAMLLKE